ncbi:S41 family peptidase [Adhaeribacter radiodurans]|uniref:S41 family peptidase n=1 Tax=Adhaeribacter radiodurans TaxID=2745197 RepID=A0A7L7L7S0_9BACT|nr:S41 family peptidase [Adhaeribacter radiodurans]QMU28794.1 S41 family peptidase [Adhaeribacter radiodurans]
MANLNSIYFFFFFYILLPSYAELQAQEVAPPLSRKERSFTIHSISGKLQENYIFPKVADKMVQSLKTNLKKGKYNSLVNPPEFARQLTNDLRETSKDKHLMVVYNPAVIAREKALIDKDRANEEAEWAKELVNHLKRDNYGFREVKILDGNIGYLDLREFTDPKYSSETLANAMHFLENTNAFIIDLRQNDGGSPEMVQLLASYFFSSEPVVHLANNYNRPKNELTKSWTLPNVTGTRRPLTDLYILTSSKTFSAAEAFSYQLKHLNRATIVGERTAGGAHLTGSVIATDKFYVRIPQGRTTSPVTNANWEGIGVTPDIEVSAEEALHTAHTKALAGIKDR